jgi:hypothetical protein
VDCVSAWSVRVWGVNLVAVHCLIAWVSIWTGWERLLVIVSCLAAWASIPRDSWVDFMKVPVDWARAWSERAWEVSLMAVHSLTDWAMTLRGWCRPRVTVQVLAAWVRTLRGCCACFMNAPTDWVMVCSDNAWDGSLFEVSLLVA